MHVPMGLSCPFKQQNVFRCFFSFTKLRALGLTEFDKIVFLGLDLVVRLPIDDLFALDNIIRRSAPCIQL